MGQLIELCCETCRYYCPMWVTGPHDFSPYCKHDNKDTTPDCLCRYWEENNDD